MPVESYWTTEQVAEHLDMTVADVYRTRRNGEYPGNIGKQRGRRLLFLADLVKAGPQDTETTSDVSTAILWTLQGIEAKLAQLVALASPTPIYYDYHTTNTTTTGDEEE